MDGALVSWAVPKGPSPDPADKRLAVHVEDHPLAYADFEGVIPEGEYGAGPTIVWDRGSWSPVGDPRAGMAAGKLLFDLEGYKLRGRWTLVKTKQDEKSWLLIKERDAWVRRGESTDSYSPESVWSGLTVDEMRAPRERAEKVAAMLDDLGAARRRVRAENAAPMLATRREDPFSRRGWIFEFKYDGYRVIAGRERGEATLRSRAGNDLTATFPEIAHAVRALPYEGLVLDGEVVVHDERGVPSFERLQQRGGLSKPRDVARAAVELPATLYAFDLLACEGRDARPLALVERKRVLRAILPSVGPIRFSDHVETEGETVYARATEIGLEGMVGKKADAPYRSGRSADWLKVRAMTTDDFVVVGWTDPGGTRSGFGALHLAQFEAGELRYAGSVGTGFDEAMIEKLVKRLAALARARPAFQGEAPKGRGHHWVEPELVVEVRFRERTSQGLLRQPAFLRLRDDKKPAEAVRQDAGPASAALAEPARVAQAPPAREVPFTNLDKVFWPDDGYTKGDLVEFYRAVAPWLLPYLRDRPLVLVRHPDGIAGKSFYQKHAPEWTASWIRTVGLWSEDSEREIDYFVCDNVESLLYVVNSAAIPLHVWSSRVATLATPDWCVLDLDPKSAPFTDVVKVAKVLHELCDEIGLPSFPKTSGSTGLHVLVPLGRRLTFDQTKTFGELLARAVVKRARTVATVERVVAKRGGKVYVDFLQNGHGKLIVAPFSVRPLPGAPVSTPLRWKEVVPSLDPSRFTIETVPRRMRSLGEDPMAAVLEEAPALEKTLERLGKLLR
jgi:bifunctional non-homologous end joining protein LigD